MKLLRMVPIIGVCISLAGCLSVSPRTDEVVVQTSACVKAEDPVLDKRGAFFDLRSALCRKIFADGIAELALKTGRGEDFLRGATISAIREEYANGAYSLGIDVIWSGARESAVEKLLSESPDGDVPVYVPSDADVRELFTWIGPRQVCGPDGDVHFLGISARAIGRNATLSQHNKRLAELDAQAMAIRAFLGEDRKISDVKAAFRPVLCAESHHTLCPDRKMFVCVYEVVSLGIPVAQESQKAAFE